MSTRKDYMLVAVKELDKAIGDLLSREDELSHQRAVKEMQRDAIIMTLTAEQREKLGFIKLTTAN